MADAPIITEVDGRRLSLTNLSKPLFADGFTKAEVIDYYTRIAPVLLPHLRDRCVTRLRFPEGSAGPSFYEKNLPNGTPEWVPRVQVAASENTVIAYLLANDVATLVWLSNLAALELHTPQWRVADTPSTVTPPIPLSDVLATTVVVDLDPGPGVSRVQMAEAAMLIATELAADGLIPFPKTSGNKGFQVSAPIVPTPSTQCVAYVGALARRLSQQHPHRFVATMAKDVRVERIYIDYLQNQAARNTITPYSLRARDFASVATPLTWDEIAGVASDADLQFSASDVIARVDKDGDLWADLLDPSIAGELPATAGDEPST